MSILLMDRVVLVVRVGRDLTGIEKLERTRRSSDIGVKMEQDEVTKEDVARVITRSRVCPESWVGKAMQHIENVLHCVRNVQQMFSNVQQCSQCSQCSGQMHQVVQERMIQLDQYVGRSESRR